MPYGQFKKLLLGFHLVVEVYFGPNLYKFSCKNGSFTDIVFRVSCPFSPVGFVKVFLDPGGDLLKNEMSIIFKPPLS